MGLKILFLSRWFPYPANNGSKLRIYNLLRGLAEHHHITLLSFADQPNIDPNAPELRAYCEDVRVVPWRPFNPKSKRAYLGFLSAKPRAFIDTFSPEMKECIEQTLADGHYDLVIASQIDMAVYGEYFNHLPAIFEEAEIGILYENFSEATSAKSRLRNGLTWAKYRRYLSAVLEKFQACTVVSNKEHQLLSQAVNGHRTLIDVIPNCVDLSSYNDVRETPQPNSMIFTGAFSFFPNYEAMVWFLQEAYPYIQAQIPDACLSITGNHGNQPLPTTDNVTLTGFVDDVRPFIARSWVSVVPIHVGGGTRLKILEAMALGTPVVSTSKGVEGIDAEPGKHLLVADTPEDFAQAVLRLFKEPDLRQKIVDNAYKLISEKYDWPVVLPRYLKLIEQVANA